jgi:hypothetical protein
MVIEVLSLATVPVAIVYSSKINKSTFSHTGKSDSNNGPFSTKGIPSSHTPFDLSPNMLGQHLTETAKMTCYALRKILRDA